MHRTVEAIVEADGTVRLLETVEGQGPRHALVTFLGELPEGHLLPPSPSMTFYHTPRSIMPKLKVAITLERELLEELDELVAQRRFPNRSQAIEAAVAETLQRMAGTRLARECAKLEPAEEKALAEEGMGAELAAWPEY
jgi:Arc/MetJ-type ribon-helix-helix transcriptional regulator